jgi:hypothetical protein
MTINKHLAQQMANHEHICHAAERSQSNVVFDMITDPGVLLSIAYFGVETVRVNETLKGSANLLNP